MISTTEPRTEGNIQMKKTLELPKGFLIIEIHKPKIKWVNKRMLSYVVKCAEQGRFDLLDINTEEIEKIIKNQEKTERN